MAWLAVTPLRRRSRSCLLRDVAWLTLCKLEALQRADDAGCAVDRGRGSREGRFEVVANHIHKLQIDERDGIHNARSAELIERIVGALRPIPGIESIGSRIVPQFEQRRPIIYE